MSMEKVSGVYQIENTVNGKVYIGSAVDIRDRWYEHLCDLRHGRDSPRLQCDFNVCGEKSFVFEVLERTPKQLLREAEQSWLDATKCYEEERGYNVYPNAFGRCHMPHLGRNKVGG